MSSQKTILNGTHFQIDNTRGTFIECRCKSETKISRTGYSFDIETSLSRKTEKSYMYVGQIAVNNTCYLFRTWDDILNAMHEIYEDGNTNNHVNIVWIANLGYEMSFLLPRLSQSFSGIAELDVFADRPRHPIYVRLKNSAGTFCLEFRDTLRVSGMNLRNTAKSYCTTQKLEMEYSEMRNSKTDITDIQDYCANDVFICNEFYDYLLEHIVDKGQYLPYTQTGIVRNLVKSDFKTSEFSGLDDSKQSFISEMFPRTEEEYNRIMHWLYSGGITHANHDFVGDVVSDVHCIDFTSSYPAVMSHENTYPMGKFYRTKLNDLISLKRKKAWYCTITLYNIRQTTAHSLISASKCIKGENIVEDNGRVMTADSITIMMNNIDYEYISKFYTWSEYRITSAYYCNTVGHLPKYLTDNMLHNGQIKAELKAAGKSDTPDYAKNKAMFNCYYGLCVQRLVRDSIKWDIESGYTTDGHDSYYKIKQIAMLSPYWGIWVTSYARRNLCLNMWNIEQTGAHVIYYDTDSLYIKDIDKAMPVIEAWNNSMYELNDKLKLHKCFHDLGAWDIDPVVTIKTLGAKRYIKVDSDGHVKATIAGLPKKAFNFSAADCFDKFTDNMLIKAADSLKLTAKYTDRPYAEEITDNSGNTELMTEFSGTALVEIPFKLTLSPGFKSLLSKLHKHY